PIGIELEEHTAADADPAIRERDAAGRQRRRQRLLERLASLFLDAPTLRLDKPQLFLGDSPLLLRHAALLLGLTALSLVLEPAREFKLHADDADQHQHEGAQQASHQVAEHGPGRRGVLQTGVDPIVDHSWIAWRCASTLS